MKWKVVSLLIDAPLIPEPAGKKGIGILGACLEFDRKKELFKQTKLLEERDGRRQG